jgi:hypothetical protein
MREGFHRQPAAVLLAAAVALWAAPAGAAGLMDAMAEGKTSADFRYRYEMVDQGGVAEDASASTLRTRLGYRTARSGPTSAFIEFENVVTLGPDDYDSTTNGKTAYPRVLDPEGTEVNQAYLDRTGDAGVTLRIGRQRLKLDNDRWVGNVGWRQREQTFDAVTLVDAHARGMAFTYAYLWNAKGVTDRDAAHDSHLIHVRYAGLASGNVSAYGYLVNPNDTPAAASQTYGARYEGRYGAGIDKTLLTLEYARQGEYVDSGVGSNDYMLGEAGVVRGSVTVLAGYEVLGGDGTDAVQTPLATLHGFNGWTDTFTTTPPGGLTDLYGRVFGTGTEWRFEAAYHAFSADTGGQDYGTEWDLLWEKRINPKHRVGIAYARYNADAFGADVDKLWAYVEAGF